MTKVVHNSNIVKLEKEKQFVHLLFEHSKSNNNSLPTQGMYDKKIWEIALNYDVYYYIYYYCDEINSYFKNSENGT